MHIVYIHIHLDVSKINDNNATNDGGKPLGLSCYYKVLTLSMERCSVI